MMADEERTVPVLYGSGYKGPGGPLRIPWSIAEKAYSVYSSRYGTGQSLERLYERGGFYAEELDEYAPGWREETSEIARLKAELKKVEVMPREKTCPICEGRGKTAPARDLLARSPRDQAEYDREHAALGEFTCSLCGGSGKVGEPAELERVRREERERAVRIVRQMARRFDEACNDDGWVIANAMDEMIEAIRGGE